VAIATLRLALVLLVASLIELAYRRIFARWRHRLLAATPVGYLAPCAMLANCWPTI
jgi:hypothetical protein